MKADDLQKQVEFIVEVDQMKQIFRRTKLIDETRYENDAEHSWHVSVMAILFQEHANEPDLDIARVLKMLLIHDIVEIDAGDTFAYDVEGHKDKREREEKGAERIFGLLPEDQGDELYALWIEFEKQETPEAKYATALDRLQPLIHNYYTDGEAWRKHNITAQQVIEMNEHIGEGSEVLWEFACDLIQKCVDKGYLAEKKGQESVSQKQVCDGGSQK